MEITIEQTTASPRPERFTFTLIPPRPYSPITPPRRRTNDDDSMFDRDAIDAGRSEGKGGTWGER